MKRRNLNTRMPLTMAIALAVSGTVTGSVFAGPKKNVALKNAQQMQVVKSYTTADGDKMKLQTAPKKAGNPNLTAKPNPMTPGPNPPMFDPGQLQPTPPPGPQPPPPPPQPQQPDTMGQMLDFTLAAMQTMQQNSNYYGSQSYPGGYPQYPTNPSYSQQTFVTQTYGQQPYGQTFGPIRSDVDIEWVRGKFHPNNFNVLVDLSYKVEIEDLHPFESFGLRMFLVEDGRQVRAANGWPIVIDVPLNAPTKFDDDEVEFRGGLSAQLPHGAIYRPDRVRLIAEVVRTSDGFVADRKERSLSY